MIENVEHTGEEVGQRWALLSQLEEWLEVPMLVLSFAWLAMVVVELVWGSAHVLEIFGTAIWIVFVVEYVLRLVLAPDRVRFVKRNWLTAIALAVPAVRILRAFRVVRVARGRRLIRVVGTPNRGMGALRASMRRRGLGYVLALSAIVILLGAGGMFAFESADQVQGGFTSYGDALWWTAMLLTSLGSDFWPVTAEGRVLCVLLSVYGFAVFGYITASFASFFVGRDAANDQAEIAGAASIEGLRREMVALRSQLTSPVADRSTES